MQEQFRLATSGPPASVEIGRHLSDHFEPAHHLVVFVGENVTVPGVFASLVKFASDLGDLARQGRDHILGSSNLVAVPFIKRQLTAICESRIRWEESLEAFDSVFLFGFQTDAVNWVRSTETFVIRIGIIDDRVAARYLEVD
jgi:hypothetical protein